MKVHMPVAKWDTCGTGCLWPHSGLGAEPEKRGLLVKRTELGLPPQPCRGEASGECPQEES